MRLIDADAFKEWVDEYYDCTDLGEIVRSWIDERPTIDAEPVRRGRWIGMDSDDTNYDDYKCSNCRKEITVDYKRFCDIGFVIEDFNYCPYCGADMRGGENG